MKDYIKDLKQCIKRLYFAEEMLNRYLDSGGQDKTFFKSLDLQGIKPEYRHPILDYKDNEKECFLYICGEPLVLPQDFTHHSAQDIRKIIEKHRDKLRYIAGMVDKSQFLGEKNYLCYKPRKRRYWTGRLVG